jgi:hypothetical protein
MLTWHDDVALGLTGQEIGAWARGRKSLTATGYLGGVWWRVRPPMRLILARLGRAFRDLSNGGGGVVIRVL